MCQERGEVVQAVIVDHIVEIKDGGDLLSEDNCQGLCAACHNRKHGWAKRERKIINNAGKLTGPIARAQS